MNVLGRKMGYIDVSCGFCCIFVAQCLQVKGCITKGKR